MNKMINQYIEKMDLKWEESLITTINDIFKDKTETAKIELQIKAPSINELRGIVDSLPKEDIDQK